MSIRHLSKPNNNINYIYCKNINVKSTVLTDELIVQKINVKYIYINNIDIYEELITIKNDIQTIKNDINNIKNLINDTFDKDI